MRKALLLGVLLVLGAWGLAAGARAQTTALLGDEWIDFQQTYYKIPVSKTGAYRFTGQDLVARGIPASVPGSQFRLFRQGREVALTVSSNNAFSATDYLEFVGYKNDGEADLPLYSSRDLQANPYQSLFSDTAWYFLTWTATGTGLRLPNATVPVPATPAATATRARAWVQKSYNAAFFDGKTNSSAYRLHSSRFEEGEGFIAGLFNPGRSYVENLPTPGGQGGELEIEAGVTGFSLDNIRTGVPGPPHPIVISVGADVVVDTTYGAQQYRRFKKETTTWNQAATTAVTFSSAVVTTDNYDYWGIHYVNLKYWRTLDFAGQTQAEFELEATPSAQLVALQNMAAVRLYDLTAQKYYDADGTVAGQARFYLEPAATPRKCLVVTAAAYTTGAPLSRVNFQNYAATGGDYVMISHPALEDGGALQAYKTYRASATGGGYTPLLAYAPDLYDQFAGGISQHPLAIKNFLARLRQSAPLKPTHVALLGHGVTYDFYRSGNSTVSGRALVPTYGHPGSDALLADGGLGALAIGRVSVINSTELLTYLNKVKAYEEALTRVPSVPTVETEAWKKKVLHIAGSSDQSLQSSLLTTLNNAATILTDTPFSAQVFTIAKNTTNPVDPFTNSFTDSVLNEGMGILTFHGHAYSGGFDYNINEPERYTNRPKLPLFIALGCNVAQIFDTGSRTVSERYVLAPQGGAITMLAANQLQFADFHSQYLPRLYSRFAGPDYLKTMGQQVAAGTGQVLQENPASAFIRTHLESMLYQGDPAVRLYQPEQPDFYLSAENLFTYPTQITSAVDSFQFKIVSFNLAKGFRDTGLTVRIRHTKPSGQTTVVREYSLATLLRADTTTVWIPFDKRADLGDNRFTLTIDPDNKIAELSEANNTAIFDLFISGSNLVPVFPYPYSIVNAPPTLKASTLDPFAPEATYLFELDTTEFFNSPLLQRATLRRKGGLVKWQPNPPFADSTVYYWRSAYAPLAGAAPVWNSSSFVYLPGAGEGWNQSHAFQYLPNRRHQLQYDTVGRTFAFSRYDKRLAVRCKVMFNDDDVDNNKVQVDEVDFQRSSCMLYNTTIQFMVLDSATGSVWQNTPDRQAAYGNAAPCHVSNRAVWAFEFSLNDSGSRNKAARFMQSIPAGKFVLAKSSVYAPLFNPTDARTWLADTSAYGVGNTLYEQLKDAGFSQVDSFYGKKAFVFWYQKGVPGATAFQRVGETDTTLIVQEFTVKPALTAGEMESVVVGPSLKWESLHWKSNPLPGTEDAIDRDTVRVYGLDSSGKDTLLFQTAARDTSLTGVSALQYPNLRLEWLAKDTLYRKARQLAYWRVHHTPLPELALNPAAMLSLQDSTVTVGQPISLKVAVENVSNTPMDSVLVRYRVVQESGRVLPLQTLRYRPLAAQDTLHATVQLSSIPYVGNNLLFIEANPDADQPEHYHPNNLGYLPFQVAGDRINPLLDVTFDSIHISDQDIVAAHPEIKIRLTAHNPYRLLDDTSLIQVWLKSPEDPITLVNGKRIPYDSSVCRFIPARYDSTGRLRNEAFVIYKSTLTQFSTAPTDNLYELVVKAKDPGGNAAGSEDYRVSFRVVATAGLSQVYNYPNPFATTTRFAFLLTGEALPKALRIRIVDLKGSEVRTLTLAELGPLRLGQNRPAYEWDGRDAAGVPLPPGLYLYKAEAETATGVLQHIPTGVDGGFKNGWGRMLFLPK